jgi:hypothetical protein
MKKQLIIPSTELFSNAKDFFTEIIKINKETNFSLRNFARKLKWPVGYISDVIAERKAFTLLRALQFAEVFSLCAVQKERLTWFAMVENGNEEVKNFFLKKLTLKSEDLLKDTIIIKNAELYNTTAAVCTFLILKRRMMIAADILQELRLSYLTEEKVNKALAEIAENKYLTWNALGELKEVNVNFTFDDYESRGDNATENIKLHKETTQNFLDYINNPSSPMTYHSGLLQIKKGQFMSVALQIIALRNWLLEISEENTINRNNEETYRLMQFDLNLFPVTDFT